MQNRQSDFDLITVAQMRVAEAHAMDGGTSGERLMERAGRGVADAICAALSEIATGQGTREEARPVAHVLCGPGNNGGDGYVIARILKDRGIAVELYGIVPADRLTGDAARMARRWDGPVHPPRRFLDIPAGVVPRGRAVIVDALFGTGLARPLEGEAARMIAHANALPMLRVAVDIPSGVDGDTGETPGVALDAHRTVTFHAMKPGHALTPGRWQAGDVAIVDIGLGGEATERARLATDGPDLAVNDARPLLAARGLDRSGHKYTRGHALVLAGGVEGVGAARLAARGALRAGAGLVTLGVPSEALDAHAARGPDALMLRLCNGGAGLAVLLADSRRNAVVIGPAHGVGAETRAAVSAVLGARRAAVLDADALTSFEGAVEALAALTRAAGNVVLTPHDGEFARLFGPALASTSRLHRALEAAAMTSAVVVLKGPSTIVAAPDGRAVVNVNAPPWLGTAGSGDVLAGVVGGLLAQGFGPWDAARAGVWLHGEAGRIAGRGLIADDLPEALAAVWRELEAAAG